MYPRRERKLNRLKNFDYSVPGLYFITICVKDRELIFGDVIKGQMILNEYGEIVKQQWLWLEEQYLYINSDEFVIMPNHLHGIITIDDDNVETGRDRVGTGRDLSLRTPKTKSLSELIGAFKTTSSKLIHRHGLPELQWQRSFYDRIIRDENELNRIKKYIIDNPINWEADRNNKENLFM